MDDVEELLRTWELPQLIPTFEEQQITIQALSALSEEDLKDLIPLAGPRVLFTRCWRIWKTEFSATNHSFSGVDISNIQFEIDSSLKDTSESSICILKDSDAENDNNSCQQVLKDFETESRKLENLLKQSLETTSLLIHKGGTLDGDNSRNLLASAIAREILNENKNLHTHTQANNTLLMHVDMVI